MSDRHVRRGPDDYAAGLAGLFPRGAAWPLEAPNLRGLISGLAKVWGDRVDPRAADLLERETDPRRTHELLPEWESAFGLPDPCVGEPLTEAARRTQLVQRMTMQGGQSRAFFISVAAMLGYAITIEECSPFMVGVSRCGESESFIAPPEMRFVWFVKVASVRFEWFRAGIGQVGVDHHLEISIATDLYCILNRWKPAHTVIFFEYPLDAVTDPMFGTP